MRIDRSRASIQKKGYTFVALRPEPDAGVALEELTLRDNLEMIVFERAGHMRALVMREMAYHHLAQGTLAGEPYLVSF